MIYRKLLSIIFVLIINICIQAQSDLTKNINGWYIGPAIKFTPIKNQFASMLGLRTGWILNEKLSIGAGFYSVFTKVDADEGAMPTNIPLNIDLQYLGFESEYILQDFNWGYISFYNLFGGGASRYVKDDGSTFKSTQQEGETIFSIIEEPGISSEFYITSWLNINTALTYRIVIGIEKENLTDSDFSGIDFTMCFKFSGF